MWIRAEFLSSAADFGKVVVHGPTPVARPDLRPNRINVDTGAFASGILTAVVLEAANGACFERDDYGAGAGAAGSLKKRKNVELGDRTRRVSPALSPTV